MILNQPVPSVGVNTTGQDSAAAGTANRNGVIFASAARTETADPTGDGAGVYVSPPFSNDWAKGLDLFVDTTSSGSGTLTVKLQKRDPASGNWYDLPGATTVAINDPADVLLTVYPGITVAANVSVSNHLGHVWRVHATVATASVTFSIGAVYLG